MKYIVTIFKTVKATQVGYNKDVSYVFERIRTGKSKKLIEKIRSGNRDLKPQLPAICFNGTFRYRSEAGLIKHSGLCVLDFDKFSEEELKQWLDTLESCEFIFARWVSPSGNGIKALVKIPAEPENHSLYFQSIYDYFDTDHLGKEGKDIPRACFESYDPDIYINYESTLWTDKAVEDVEDIGTDSPVVPLTSENQIINRLMVWWKNKFGATKGERNNNIYRLAIAFNDFGIERNEAERVLLSFTEKDFNEKEILAISKSAYKNVSTFGTKFFEDTATKKRIEKMVRAGKKEKDVKKTFPKLDTDKIVEGIKDKISIDEFWVYNSNGQVVLSPHKYKFWLEQHNFFKYYPNDSGGFIFIRKDQNILSDTSDKRIKDYVLEYLLQRDEIGFMPYDYMAKKTEFFTPNFLSMIDTANVHVKEDTQDECYIYFNNCAVRTTKDTIEEIDYIDLDGFVWKKQIIERDFEKADHHDSEFRTFVWKVSGEDVERYNSLKSILGYMLHSFKTSANNKAVILNDEIISDNPNGGSGKGLTCQAISQMKKTASIDGKTFDFTKSFPYQTVSTDTQVLFFDDVKKNFNFESLFSLITEGITLEYKGQDAIKLPVEQSPKILITTNYTIQGSGGSFDRRKFEIELSSYFNSNHTPLDEFGHLLFDEWNDDEWNKFYSYMLNCIQYYLENGLVSYSHKNLHLRKFINSTSQEFYEWVEDKNINTNVRYDRKQMYIDFIDEYGDMKKWLKQNTYTKWVEKYAKFKGLEVIKGKTHGDRWVMLSDSSVEIKEEDTELPF